MTKSNEWDRRKDENDNAWLAFQCYLELGQGKRSISKAWPVYVVRKELKGRLPSAAFKRWCSQRSWVTRCAAYDDHRFSVRMEAAHAAVEEARAILMEGAIASALTLKKFASGRQVYSDTEIAVAFENDEALLPPQVAAMAAKELLDRVGVIKPTKLEITGANQGPIETKVRLDLSRLSKAELRILAALKTKATAEDEDE